jgi:hypothetical protein
MSASFRYRRLSRSDFENCQTSVLFRLGAISFHLRLHGRHSEHSLREDNVQVEVPGSALLIREAGSAALQSERPFSKSVLSPRWTLLFDFG